MKKLMLIGLLCYVQSAGILAQGLTLETYVKADVEARQRTIDGMYQQIDLLNSGANEAAINQASSSNQNQVDSVFEFYGTTGVTHSAYGGRHSKEIEQWLAGHSNWQQSYDALDDEFASLSQQLRTLREGQ